jgi:hypothetical protein
MQSIELFKSFGLLSIIIITTAGSFMVWKGPRDQTKSVSFHAGTANKKLYTSYAFAFIIATTLFYLFCMFWLIPTLVLPFGFIFLLHLMTILLVLTALIPEKDKKIIAHAIVAYGFAFCMMLLLVFIAISSHVPFIARIFSEVVVGWMALGWFLAFLSPYKTKFFSHYLIFQYSYVILFFLSILIATYIR